MTKEDKRFIESCRKVIKGLNDFSIVHPELAETMNKATDMLERRVKETLDKESCEDKNKSLP